ncbi:MAG: PDZ domain-containing protein [Gemmatimonadota bacterium]
MKIQRKGRVDRRSVRYVGRRTLKGWTGVALGLAMLWVAPPPEVHSQERRGTEAERRALAERQAQMEMRAQELRERSRDAATQVMGRVRLGVALEEARDDSGSVVGVRIREVMDESPAQTAGLLAGDLVVSIDGRSLLEGEPSPGGAMERLTQRTRRLRAGDEVELEVVRDGENRTVTVVAGDLAAWAPSPMALPGLSFRRPPAPDAPEAPRLRFFRSPDEREIRVAVRAPRVEVRGLRGGSGLGLTLQDLNPELGSYFGVEDGVVVIRVDDGSPLPLRAGDVILGIGGREVMDARHVREILDSYREGESVTLRVRRRQREESLEFRFR